MIQTYMDIMFLIKYIRLNDLEDHFNIFCGLYILAASIS